MSRDHEFELVASFRHALSGLAEVARTERNFRIHLVATIIAVGLGVWLTLTKTEWLLLTLAIVSVLILEVLNAVVERLVDLVKPRLHPILHDVKDMMAATVLIAAVGALVMGYFIFLPHLVTRFGG